jgi:hypothetical protein
MNSDVLNESQVKSNPSLNHPVKQGLVRLHKVSQWSFEAVVPHEALQLTLDPSFQVTHQ